MHATRTQEQSVHDATCLDADLDGKKSQGSTYNSANDTRVVEKKPVQFT